MIFQKRKKKVSGLTILFPINEELLFPSHVAWHDIHGYATLIASRLLSSRFRHAAVCCRKERDLSALDFHGSHFCTGGLLLSSALLLAQVNVLLVLVVVDLLFLLITICCWWQVLQRMWSSRHFSFQTSANYATLPWWWKSSKKQLCRWWDEYRWIVTQLARKCTTLMISWYIIYCISNFL